MPFPARAPEIRLARDPFSGPPVASGNPEVAFRWLAAVAEARQLPCAEAGLMSRLFSLVSWPNLTRLPPELAVPAARICGLLWHKRTAGALIPRVLDLPAAEVAVLLHALLALGHVEATGAPLPCGPAGSHREEPALPPPLPEQSLLGKFRRWLVTVH